MKMNEIAQRIKAHLARFEADPVINAPRDGKPGGLTPYYWTNSFYAGNSKLGVVYVSFQKPTHLSKTDALKYLAWLDAGNVGRHYEALRNE